MSDHLPNNLPVDATGRELIWVSVITVAADKVETLRRCDVERVVSLVNTADRTGFIEWLITRRPDLAGAIAEALSALAQEA